MESPSLIVSHVFLPLILTLLGTVALSLVLKYKSRILNCNEENKNFVKDDEEEINTKV